MTASISFLFTSIPIFLHTIHPHAWYPSYPSLIPIILLTYPSPPFLSLHHTSHPSHYPFSFSHTNSFQYSYPLPVAHTSFTHPLFISFLFSHLHGIYVHDSLTFFLHLPLRSTCHQAHFPLPPIAHDINNTHSTLNTLPGSKSISNRILLLLVLSDGTTSLLNSEDVHCMLGAPRTLGLQVEEQSENQRVIVQGHACSLL